MNLKDFNEVQIAKEKLIMLASMKKGGWRADQPMLSVSAMPGVDTICGKDFLDELNVELNKFLKKLNRKILKQAKVVEKEMIGTLETVEGLKEEVFGRFPTLDPDYVATELGAEGPNKEIGKK